MPKTQEPSTNSSSVMTAESTVVHLISQTKGGVGKSVAASWIASCLRHRGKNPHCYDADPGNRTFSRFKSLEVQPIDLMRDGDVDPALYDVLVEEILNKKGDFVIDTGSSSFLSLWNYIDKSQLFDVMASAGVEMVIHVPLAAEPDLVDTIDGFCRIAGLAPDKSVVLWLNQRGKKIEHGGVDVLSLQALQERSHKVRGTILNSRQLYPLHRDTVGKMLHANATFGDSFGLNSMERMRLEQVKAEVYRQMEEIGI